MPAPAIGRVVRNFTAPATGDQKISLKELRGRNVVLYFYPRDNTPGCTTEGKDFAVVHCPRWTTFGVVKEGRRWHAYNEKGQGVSLQTSAAALVKLLADW